MRDGYDVIYQGVLTAPGWRGYSDFLIKVDAPSKLGSWSYEVVDTKLARTAKPKHILQLCVYSELVALEQGVLPRDIHVVLGDQTQQTLRLNDFYYYSAHVRGRFTGFVSGDSLRSVPERCPHCQMCHWSDKCADDWDREGKPSARCRHERSPSEGSAICGNYPHR
jgi:uncharacterized protein